MKTSRSLEMLVMKIFKMTILQLIAWNFQQLKAELDSSFNHYEYITHV